MAEGGPSAMPFAADVDMSDMMPIADPEPQRLLPPSHSTEHAPASSTEGGLGPANAASSVASVQVGAGPLPTGFGLHTTQTSTGSTLTEFTKRRNWSKLVLEELRDLMLILSPDGRIHHVSPSCKLLTGYDPYMLVNKFVHEFIHDDDKGMFTREFNESIASGNQLRFFYRFRTQDGSWTIFEAFGHPHLTSDALNFSHGGARFCRGFFMMSRPYPTKNAALLDSFLEHKIENERLTKRIAELKREEQDEQDEQQKHLGDEGQSTATVSESLRTETRETRNIQGSTSNSEGMPPPVRPASMNAPLQRYNLPSSGSVTANTALTRQNLDEALAAARPDSISDKMARYEGATHIETIEMLTGLRYRDGERSQGISTGASSPALIRGDAGIAILADRENRANVDRKKKTKVADEYVCTDCGTLDSPEWRKGPNGPKTLCNACGCKSISRALLALLSLSDNNLQCDGRKSRRRISRKDPHQVGCSCLQRAE
jgi:PAS domain S-box-containing protein